MQGRVTFLILLCCSCVMQATTTLTFQPDSACGKDAVIASLWPDINSGTHPDFLACAWTNQGNPSTTRALISFDLATIPANATIISATLELYHYPSLYNTGHSNLSGPANCWLQRIIQPWSEQTVTWNNQPATTGVNQVNVMAPFSNTQNYTLTVTDLVTDMLNDPANSFGFMLRQQTESYYRSLLFASSDMGNPAFYPKLTVVYQENLLPVAGCWTDVVVTPDSISSNPVAADPEIVIPNVFTPNNDGVNDVFFADTVNVTITSLEIYNRWGNLLFRSAPGTFWNGNSESGNPCSDGTYYYLLEYRTVNGEQRITKGFFTLIR